MSHNPNRIICRCGRGKVSAYDGKCGHCRTNREKEVHAHLLDGFSEAAGRRSIILRKELGRRFARYMCNYNVKKRKKDEIVEADYRGSEGWEIHRPLGFASSDR